MSIFGVAWVTLLVFHIVMIPLVSRADDAAPDTLPKLEQILDRYVKAVGGQKAIEKLKTRTRTGWQIDDRPYRGPVEVTPLESYSMVPDKWVFLLHHQKATYRDGFDGEVGWRVDSQGIVRNDSKGRSKLAWLLNPQEPLRIQEYFAGMEVKGRGTVGECSGPSDIRGLQLVVPSFTGFTPMNAISHVGNSVENKPFPIGQRRDPSQN